MRHVPARAEVHTGFCWGNLSERDQLEDLGVNEKIALKRVLKVSDGGA